jgi:hypothetical protein
MWMTTTTTTTLEASGDHRGDDNAVIATLVPNQSVAAGIRNAHASDDLRLHFNLRAELVCLSETDCREHRVRGPRRP